MSYLTPNMNLLGITIGTDTGLTIETNQNANVSTLDGHNHSPGFGVPIPPSGLNINSALSFNGNAATMLQASTYTPQASLSTLLSVYAVGPDLFYNDGNGNVIQITRSGAVTGATGTITGLPSGTASASFSAGTFTFNAATLTPANIQGASFLLGNNSASTNFLTLSPPAAMASSYTVTLPPLPSVSNSFVTMDTGGNLTAVTTIDGTSIINTAGVLSAVAGAPDNVSITANSGILSAKNTEFTYEFKLNGNYGYLGTANQVDGLCFFNYNVTIVNAWAWIRSAGSSGTTNVDLKVATAPGGSFTSIFSTTPKFASTAGASAYVDSAGVVTPGTGVTAGVLSTTSIAAGSAIRMDLLGSMVNPDSVGITIIFKQR